MFQQLQLNLCCLIQIKVRLPLRDMRQRDYQLHWRAITAIYDVLACVKQTDSLFIFQHIFFKYFAYIAMKRWKMDKEVFIALSR